MKRLLLGLAAAVGLHSLSAAGFAQVVQVGPGYVRAPFVRVYSGPGGAYVRAPFVEVGGVGPRYVQRYPAPEELSQMDWRTLRLVVRDSAAQLDAQLNSFSTGDLWRAHLKLAEVRSMAQAGEGAPTATDAANLQEIHRIFATTRDNPAYRNITGLDGFRGLFDALGEFAAPPAERSRRQLVAAWADLNRSLESLGAEAGWQRHLALPPGVAREAESKTSGPDLEEVAKTLRRYDSVSQNDQYRVVARLPAFRATHELLADYLGALKAIPAAPLPPAEELPLPPPPK